MMKNNKNNANNGKEKETEEQKNARWKKMKKMAKSFAKQAGFSNKNQSASANKNVKKQSDEYDY